MHRLVSRFQFDIQILVYSIATYKLGCSVHVPAHQKHVHLYMTTLPVITLHTHLL